MQRGLFLSLPELQTPKADIGEEIAPERERTEQTRRNEDALIALTAGNNPLFARITDMWVKGVLLLIQRPSGAVASYVRIESGGLQRDEIT